MGRIIGVEARKASGVAMVRRMRLEEDRYLFMDDETKRRLVYGLLSLVLGAIATRLAMYLTNRLLGEPEEGF